LFGFLGFLGIKFNIFNMRSKLNTKLFNLIYKRKLKELQL
jgi:hypothetical protein